MTPILQQIVGCKGSTFHGHDSMMKRELLLEYSVLLELILLQYKIQHVKYVQQSIKKQNVYKSPRSTGIQCSTYFTIISVSILT